MKDPVEGFVERWENPYTPTLPQGTRVVVNQDYLMGAHGTVQYSKKHGYHGATEECTVKIDKRPEPITVPVSHLDKLDERVPAEQLLLL